MLVWLGFVALLVTTALLTGYTRNYQASIVLLSRHTGEYDGGLLTPPTQHIRIGLTLLLWLTSFMFGFAYIQFYKTVAAIAASFVLGVPLTASFTPRKGSAHFVIRLRAFLRARLANGFGGDQVKRRKVEAVLAKLDGVQSLG